MNLFFPFYKQYDVMDCGPTCLRMIAKHYGKDYSPAYLREISYITKQGVSFRNISLAAERIGFRTMIGGTTVEKLADQTPLPCILHWDQDHFVVLYKISRQKDKFYIADPARGRVSISASDFRARWAQGQDGKGFLLMLSPSSSFYEQTEAMKGGKGWLFLYRYIKPYSKLLVQLLVTFIAATLISLVLPFLTQSLVDNGIQHRNINFVYLVLISQLVLFAGNMAIDVIRSWILIHINARVNISILSDFLIKLMKLPVRLFDSKHTGDIIQRVNDHRRIESFLTGTTLNSMFSLLNILVFSIVLGVYSGKIFLTFFLGSVSAIGWILLFMRKRKSIDYTKFRYMSDNQDSLYEMITGMQEIRLNNNEVYRRWKWEQIQGKLFAVNLKGLSLEQWQQVGTAFCNQLKNILISYFSATEVLSGNISLGMMLSISYIVGQMNSPVDQLLAMVRSAQDAKISLDRLREIHEQENEDEGKEATGSSYIIRPQFTGNGSAHSHEGGIVLENVSFQYEGPESPYVLKDINLTIPYGKTTAIVGTSGSGKTTLMKMLLKFYAPASGIIRIEGEELDKIPAYDWRSRCGVVMQDGFIFSDTIARNIAMNDEYINAGELDYAVEIANIQDLIRRAPKGFDMKIGNTGAGLSAGQKQRILIARAVYKNPAYLFFDEATSALDARNEKKIIENLRHFFKGRTVLVIAHRLSTVKEADQIVVLENGCIVETGDHQTLTEKKGKYFELVKNQLELGN
ncbi:peptidase domain-containing ABC transporter [Chitinophaga tropicalis]|uniref:ATP-binding cassette domain-containing protein n=1 Tax=Chitinophaga tropicalis TaxID=2683588 RepID=A0A7K1UB02_9BACT|nr:peptidase domain-containing ABC transporter [Chitinophaga tropicalis]MVT11440.1 ATP-binding cassette domain-containing protein [Chitinophaga tropicalis]